MSFNITHLYQQNETWTFSLLYCNDCNDSNTGKSIDCLKVENCVDWREGSDMCDMWSDFRNGGFTYFACAFITMFACIAVIEKCILQLFYISHVDHSWGITWSWVIWVV